MATRGATAGRRKQKPDLDDPVQRVLIVMRPTLQREVDDWAEVHALSRSAAIAQLLRLGFEAHEQAAGDSAA